MGELQAGFLLHENIKSEEKHWEKKVKGDGATGQGGPTQLPSSEGGSGHPRVQRDLTKSL